MMEIYLIVLLAFAVTALGTSFNRRIERMQRDIKDLNRRIEDVADAGKTVNKDLRATQEQVNDAIRRAKL